MFINGERLAARSGKTFDAIDPASGSAFARVAEGDPEDIDAAVEDHIADPRDDLIGYLLDVDVGGQKLSPQHIRGTIELLLTNPLPWLCLSRRSWPP